MKEEKWKRGEKKEMEWGTMERKKAGGAGEHRRQGITVMFKGRLLYLWSEWVLGRI